MGFLYFCFFLIFLMFIFLILTNKYVNPYKLIMIFGKKGSGKSTTLTKLAIQHVRKGWTVYSTERIPYTFFINACDIGFVQLVDYNYKPFDPDDYKGLSKLFHILKEKIKPTRPRILLLVDEVGMIWDNRQYKNFSNSVRDFFKLQRHYHVKVVMFSQTFDVDKKLRDLTDSMYLQRNFARIFTIGKKIKKFISINNNGDDGGKLDEYFDFEPAIFFFLGTRTLTYIPKWAKYFNSFEAPALQEVEYIQTEYKRDNVPEISPGTEPVLDNEEEVVQADEPEGGKSNSL